MKGTRLKLEVVISFQHLILMLLWHIQVGDLLRD